MIRCGAGVRCDWSLCLRRVKVWWGVLAVDLGPKAPIPYLQAVRGSAKGFKLEMGANWRSYFSSLKMKGLRVERVG